MNHSHHEMSQPEFRRARIVIISVCAIAIIAAIIPAVLHAVAHTVNFTAEQDTLIQTRLVPAYNRMHCAQYNRSAGCTSANLVSSGCVVRSLCTALGLPPAGAACTTLAGLNVESCVIYTANAAGEDLLLQELLSQDFARIYLESRNHARADFAAAFAAASGANQNSACTAIGLASGCDGP